MSRAISQRDRILPARSRKLFKGIGPAAKAIPELRKNKPGKSVGIKYVNDGLRPAFSTRIHVFKK